MINPPFEVSKPMLMRRLINLWKQKTVDKCICEENSISKYLIKDYNTWKNYSKTRT